MAESKGTKTGAGEQMVCFMDREGKSNFTAALSNHDMYIGC